MMVGVPLSRVATTYKALSGGLEPYLVGVLSAVFTILPVFLAMQIGRLNDRGHVGATVLAGSLLVAGATALLWLGPPSLPSPVAGTLVLGIGQTLGLAGLQFTATRVSGRYHRDNVLGNYMMVMSFGSGIGPLFIGLTGSSDEAVIAQRLLAATTGLAVFGLAVAVLLMRYLRRRPGGGGAEPAALGALLTTRGMLPLLLASGLSVAAQDLVLVFTPVLGLERGISVAVVGYLIATRAVFSVASRFFFGRLVRLLGRHRVVVAAMAVAGVGFALLAAPLPLPLTFFGMALAGSGVGVASTGTVSLMLVAAPAGMRATALSLRLTANRILQFSIPLAASPIAALAGVGGSFAVLALVLLLSGAHVQLRARSHGN